MPIHPLPQFEADIEAQRESDRKLYESMAAPKTLVVRYGFLKMVGEFPYDGTVKPGCGSKLVIRTPRGTEMGEMLTTTCPNSGCGKSISRKQMLEYIGNSGGREYPFHTEGRVLRVATSEDMETQARLEQSKHGIKMEARSVVEPLKLPMKVVDAEPILGGERLTIFYTSEERIDLALVGRVLSEHFKLRVDVRHVGARDEARLTADYERCGQYCCCKNFLKVLKPVSMRSAKVQKATLDPLKISGRCGRLMCCLRYEDETYDELRKRLPHKKTRVGTPDGDGYVLDTQILTQLALIRLDVPNTDGTPREIAVPIEELTEPVSRMPPPMSAVAGPVGGVSPPSSRAPGAPDRRDRTGVPVEKRQRTLEGREQGARGGSGIPAVNPQREGTKHTESGTEKSRDTAAPRSDAPPRHHPRPPQRPADGKNEIDEIMEALDQEGGGHRQSRSDQDRPGRRRRRRGRRPDGDRPPNQ